MSDESARPGWLDSPLRLARAVLADVDAHAREQYPSESCGFLTGPAADTGLVDAGQRAVNLADKYHKVDPETFPRTSREFYMIDARVIQKSFEQGDSSGRPVKVIYHSHCDCGAYFSAEDRAGAAPEGQLSYPAVYLVTSVREGGVVDDHRLFSFRDGGWVEVPFEVVDA